jgi:C-terminal processing protease CtpA/Prc
LLVVCADLINDQGAEAPCIGIGPIGGPLAKKCVDAFLQAGFLREQESGTTGLTIATSGNQDGTIVKIEPGSPADQAGLSTGDTVLAVDGKPTSRTPGELVRQRSFGKRGDTLHLTVLRNGATLNVALVRAPATPPPTPKVGGFMITVKTLFNWQGQFVPCMGAGPAGFSALEFCYHRFEPYGFVKAGEYGSTGFEVDVRAGDKAVITSVDAGSPAAAADLRAGDEIAAIEGKPLAPNPGETANEYLFGKVGDQRKLTLRTAHGKEKTVVLALAEKPGH